MSHATMTSKGQVTIPAEVRRSLGLTAGSQLEFIETDTGSYEIIPANTTVRSLEGIFAPSSVSLSIEDMNDVIADAAAELPDDRR